MSGLTIFSHLGASSIVTDPVDEAVHTGVALEMARTGSYVPTFHGVTYLGKPPLKMWITARLLRWFGPSETIVRLPDATAALLSGLCIWALAWRRHGGLSATLAPLVLFTSPYFVFLHGAREGVQDSAVTLAVTVAVAAFVLAAEGRPRWLLVAGLAMAVGVQVKSLVGILPIGIGVACIVVERRFSLLARTSAWLALALPLASYGVYSLINPGDLGYNIVRRGLSWKQHLFPWWMYLAWFRDGLGWWWLPALLGTLLALWSLLRSPRAFDGKVLAWAFGILVPFSLSVSKLAWYVYPMYPAAALLAARALLPPELWRRPGRVPVKGLSLVLAGALAGGLVWQTHARTLETRVSLVASLLDAAAPTPQDLYLLGLGTVDLCPDEEFYLAKGGLRAVAVTTAADLVARLATERGAAALVDAGDVAELARLGTALVERLRVARYAGACDLWGERDQGKHRAGERALMVMDRDDLPEAFVPIVPVSFGRGFFAPEPAPGRGLMQWMGARGEIEVGAGGTAMLAVDIQPFHHGRTIVVELDGQLLLERRIEGWERLEVGPFELPEEGGSLSVRAIGGCDVVASMLPDTADRRCVSIALAAPSLVMGQGEGAR